MSVRVLAVADSDSYLKWTAATAAAMPADWNVRVVVVANPVMPSPAQVAAVGGSPVRLVSVARLIAMILTDRPDVVLLGCTGPTVDAITRLPVLRGRDRPVLMTGLPGMSIPATRRAITRRAAVDLFVAHSRRERDAFATLAGHLAPQMVIGLARLPFLADVASRGPAAAAAHESAGDVLFAAQAKVPPLPEERSQILQALAGVRPAGSAVVKLRALLGEQQTHRETWPYPELWARLVAEGRVPADSVRFAGGSMRDSLGTAEGLVTVSSTAALEAMAEGIGVVVLSDFGVSADMINLAFEGSGCLGTLEDARERRFRHPSPRWLADNYFHPDEESDWVRLLRGLVAIRAGGGLPSPYLSPVTSLTSLTRRHARLWLPARTREMVLRARDQGRRVTRLLGPPAPDRTALAPLPGHQGG